MRYMPNKQKPVKNTRLFGFFHTSDPSISRDNSRVVEVNVDDLSSGLGPSFCTVNLSLFHQMNTGFLHGKIIFLSSTLITFLKTPGKGGDT